MNNISIQIETFPVKTKLLKPLEEKYIVIDDGQKKLRLPLKEDIDMNDVLSTMYDFTKGRKECDYSISANIKVDDD